MGRPRRRITEDGYLYCTKCLEYKHITEFYCEPRSVWVCIDDTWYGKPMSYCKTCMKVYAEANKVRKRLLADRTLLEQQLDRDLTTLGLLQARSSEDLSNEEFEEWYSKIKSLEGTVEFSRNALADMPVITD